VLPADLPRGAGRRLDQTHYQPIVRMSTAAGALEARPPAPPRPGMLLPIRFIPPMEPPARLPMTEAVLLRAFDDWDAERLETLDLALAFNFPVDVLCCFPTR